ncbi:hypothetical protein D9615_005017 [Tricholomella constricta]|uniref:Uncharacterized protein n=1 Tax=Tricholomella constricta TaxID=117010 RepID=A0A8H5HHR4_9AGAR|nr:hypothetical protein D9615_005017 [Tricholomella constricta]
MAEAQATFKEIPEIFEVELGEALTARTESLSTFRELGPPDLCHVVKNTGRSGQRDLGSYHYISGVDASSSASLAAYINSLTYAIEDNSAWFSKNAAWKVRNGCYCCFNAFSRVDVRVDVKIPGGVNAYVIDLRGERHEATPEMWQETYVSAILRAILYSDDPTYSLEAYRKLDPITSPEGEIRFLQGAEALFLKGWQVGSDPEIQVATVVSNHLTAGVLKYFGDSGRFQQAANLFEKLAAREPEVASLLAKSYIGMNEEVKAVQIMASAMKQTPQSYTLLHVQCDFLRSKGKYEWALKLARQAVNCAPSEFVTWEKLTELYMDLRQYESALLTLNSCPMFTFNGRDAHRPLPAAKISLPFTRSIGEILPDRQRTEDDEADPALQRLPAPGLRGTWARAYSLLTRLVSQIGWDELLKTRSSVFVMEEEYRMQKAQGEINQVITNANGVATENDDGDAGRVVIHEDGTVAPRPRESVSSPDDNASTRGMMSTKSSIDTSVNGSTLETSIPMIRVSTESDREREEEDISRAATPKIKINGENEENGMGAMDLLEKPVQAAAGEGEQTEGEALAASTQEPFSFSNKRLCERWLDNLFMVLYEASHIRTYVLISALTLFIQDLRVWTIFRAEVAHFKTQHVAYRKTGLEWEILGDLGLRLHHKEEAKEAYQRCLDSPRYSAKPWLKLMETYADEGDIQRSIQTAIRVAAYQYAEYTEMTFPTQIARSFFKLGQIHGHAKISFTLISMGLPDPILKIMDSYLQYGKGVRFIKFQNVSLGDIPPPFWSLLHNLKGVKELEVHQMSFETPVHFFRYICTLPALEALSISKSSIQVAALDIASLRPKLPFCIPFLDVGMLSPGILDWFLAQDPVPPVHTFRINLGSEAENIVKLRQFTEALGPSIRNLQITLPSDIQAYYRTPRAVDFCSFSNIRSVYLEGYLRLGEQSESRRFEDLMRTTFTQISSPILEKVSLTVSLCIDETLLYFGIPDHVLLDIFSWGALPEILGQECGHSLRQFHLTIRGLPPYQRKYMEHSLRKGPFAALASKGILSVKFL